MTYGVSAITIRGKNAVMCVFTKVKEDWTFVKKLFSPKILELKARKRVQVDSDIPYPSN